MAISSYFFNAVESGGEYDRVYNSEDVTSYLDKIVGDGVFPNPSTNFQVQAQGGMNVAVQPGQGWIQGHKMISDATEVLAIAAAHQTLPRIDAVVFYVDYTSRDMGFAVLTGTPASSPVAPTLTRTATRYEMCLAQIAVAKQVTSITSSVITDTRGNSSLCGYVQGLVQQIDTTTLWQQQQANYNAQIEANQGNFEDWFNQVKEEVATVTLLQKLEQVFTTTSTTVSSFDVTYYIPNYKYSIDILEIYIDGLRLDDNEYTMQQSTVTLATPITHAGTEVALVVYKSIDGSDAETIVDQVQQMQETVDAIATGVYLATGANDNIALSTIVKNFISGGNDYKQLEIDVYGDFAITAPALSVSASKDAYWFDFGNANDAATTRRVKLNFEHCSRLVVNVSSLTTYQHTVFMCGTGNVEIANLQLSFSGSCNGVQLFNPQTAPTVVDSAFWVNATAASSYQVVGAYQGTFERVRMSIANSGNGKAYAFTANGGLLQLTDCELYAYNSSSTSNEAVAVQVQAGVSDNVLMITNCTLPIKARSGFKQDNVVKVNSGYATLLGNALGMAALFYSDDNCTEFGTMIVSKTRMVDGS